MGGGVIGAVQRTLAAGGIVVTAADVAVLRAACLLTCRQAAALHHAAVAAAAREARSGGSGGGARGLPSEQLVAIHKGAAELLAALPAEADDVRSRLRAPACHAPCWLRAGRNGRLRLPAAAETGVEAATIVIRRAARVSHLACGLAPACLPSRLPCPAALPVRCVRPAPQVASAIGLDSSLAPPPPLQTEDGGGGMPALGGDDPEGAGAPRLASLAVLPTAVPCCAALRLALSRCGRRRFGAHRRADVFALSAPSPC